MNNNLFSEQLRKELNQTIELQLVYFPDWGLEFYQWLLQRTKSGLEVEMVIAFPYTVRNVNLNPGYFQRLIQAGGKLYIHPGKEALMPFLWFNDQAIIPDGQLGKKSGYKLEKTTAPVQHLKQQFQEYKEQSVMPTAGKLSNGENEPLSGDAPLLSLISSAINIHFYTSAHSVGVYEHFELFWEVKGAEEVSIQPLLGSVPAKGSKVLSAEQSIEFQLIASNGTHSLSRVTSVMVDPKPYLEYLLLALNDDPAKNVVLRANPDYPDQFGIVQGQVLRLGWRAINTTELKLDGALVATTDSIVLAPKGMNVFSFSARGKHGTLSKTIIVNALAPHELGPVSLTIPTAVATHTIADLPPIAADTIDIPWEKVDKPLNSKKTNRPIAVQRPEPYTFRDFLLFCSGASREVLLQCPDFERNKYAGIGATVLFTGLLAALSGGYALYVAFRSILAALFFALIWGTAIFNLDRLIVSSIRKEAGVRKQIGQSIPRFLLALVLSVVIAKPMEIRIFQPEIEEVLAAEKAAKISQLDQLFRGKIQAVDAKVASIKAETQANFQIRENLYQEYRCECDGTCGTGKIGRGSECERKEAKYRQADEEYQALKAENESLILDLRTEIKTLEQKSQVAQQALQSQFTEGLMARLGAANQLPFWPSFFISLLIFLIEVAPILSKILIPAGPYDKAIQVQERSFAAAQDQLLHQQTEQTSQQTNLQEQQQQLEVEQQLERNREILRMIAGSQIQLVRDQVNRWMENERNKLKKG